jgi:hypothetical protein
VHSRPVSGLIYPQLINRPEVRASEAALPRSGPTAGARRGTIEDVQPLVAFFRANPQALVLLIICVVLGLGTFLVVVLGIASSGSTTTNGYSTDTIFGFGGLLR